MRLDRTARIIMGQINKQYGKASKLNVKPVDILPFNNLSEAEKLATTSQAKYIFAQMEAMPELIKGMGDIVFAGEKFVTKKTKLVEAALSFEDKNLARKIQNAKNGDELYKLCYKYSLELSKQGEDKMKQALAQTNGKFTLEIEQLANEIRTDKFNKVSNLYNAIKNPSTNPRVIEIENQLKNEFGMKYVSLEDDLPRAEQILRVVKGLKSKGYPITDNVIVSDLHWAAGEMCVINGEKTIFLQSTNFEKATVEAGNDPAIISYILKRMTPNEFNAFQQPLHEAYMKGLTQFSTISEDHLITHECLHGNHTFLLAFFQHKFPAKFKPTIKNISLYTNMNTNTAEVLTELESKLYLTGELTKEEMELYKYIKRFQIYA